MTQQQVVGRDDRRLRISQTGGMDAHPVPQIGRAEGLIDGNPALHPISQVPGHHIGILGKSQRGRAAEPAAAIVLDPRQIPVIQRERWLDVVFEQLIDQPIVERQPLRIGGAGALGNDPRPGHREPVRADAQLGHERHILAHPVVVIGGDVAVLSLIHRSGYRGKHIPDGRTAPVLLGSPFNLVRRGGHSPLEIRWKDSRQSWTVLTAYLGRPSHVANCHAGYSWLSSLRIEVTVCWLSAPPP